MTNTQIRNMLSDIISSLDYDIWKDIFSEDPEDPELSEDLIDEMTAVVRKHIK